VRRNNTGAAPTPIMSLLYSKMSLNRAGPDFGVVALSRGACVQDAAITDCHRQNTAIRHSAGGNRHDNFRLIEVCGREDSGALTKKLP
jgi:hypothetical protein